MKNGIRRKPKAAKSETEPEREELETFNSEFLSDEDLSMEDLDFSVDLTAEGDNSFNLNADDDETRLLDYMEATLQSDEDEYQKPTDFSPLNQNDIPMTTSWEDQFLLYTNGNSIVLYDLEHPSADPIRRPTVALRDPSDQIALCNLTVSHPTLLNATNADNPAPLNDPKFRCPPNNVDPSNDVLPRRRDLRYYS